LSLIQNKINIYVKPNAMLVTKRTCIEHLANIIIVAHALFLCEANNILFALYR